MTKFTQRVLIAILFTAILASALFVPALAQENDVQDAVKAVLFYSPTCPHCEDLIQNFLPPLLEQYGSQLKIVAINTSLPEGQILYQSAIEFYQIPSERLGVPTMIVEDIVMVGSGEIPAQLPGLVESGLANGGTEWPAFPGLAEVIANVQFKSQPSGQVNQVNDDSNPMIAKFLLDPVANSIAVVVLIIMIASIVGVIISFTRPVPEKEFWPKWVIPVLSAFGMGVAFYLTYVETSGVEAVCGPVGDCNTVQLSPYATLFGVLPVGLLGLIGYALILVGWALYHYGPQSLRWASAIGVWGMAFFGVLFSIYLTFLEPFVIGATCMWCISSAILMTVTFLAATGPAKRAWKEDEDLEDLEFFEEEGEPALPEESELLTETNENFEDSEVAEIFEENPNEE